MNGVKPLSKYQDVSVYKSSKTQSYEKVILNTQ